MGDNPYQSPYAPLEPPASKKTPLALRVVNAIVSVGLFACACIFVFGVLWLWFG